MSGNLTVADVRAKPVAITRLFAELIGAVRSAPITITRLLAMLVGADGAKIIVEEGHRRGQRAVKALGIDGAQRCRNTKVGHGTKSIALMVLLATAQGALCEGTKRPGPGPSAAHGALVCERAPGSVECIDALRAIANAAADNLETSDPQAADRCRAHARGLVDENETMRCHGEALAARHAALGGPLEHAQELRAQIALECTAVVRWIGRTNTVSIGACIAEAMGAIEQILSSAPDIALWLDAECRAVALVVGRAPEGKAHTECMRLAATAWTETLGTGAGAKWEPLVRAATCAELERLRSARTMTAHEASLLECMDVLGAQSW